VRELGGAGVREKPRWRIFGAKFEIKVSNINISNILLHCNSYFITIACFEGKRKTNLECSLKFYDSRDGRAGREKNNLNFG
jgi:hypothetical protein